MNCERMIELFHVQKIEKHGDCILVFRGFYDRSDRDDFCIPLRSVVCATGKEWMAHRMINNAETKQYEGTWIKRYEVTLRMIDGVEIKLCDVSLSDWMALAYPAKKGDDD